MKIRATRLLAIHVLMVLFCIQSAGAYTGVTAFWYNDSYDNYDLNGYVETYRDWWDWPAGYEWDSWCQCYWYHEDSALEAWAQLDSPAGPYGAAGSSGYGYAGVYLTPFRPSMAGSWWLTGEHYFARHWWQEQLNWQTEQYEWVYVGADHYYWGASQGRNVPCTVPTGEDTSFLDWAEQFAMFKGYLRCDAGSASFSGRQVTEETGGGASDSCHFPGSQFDPEVRLSILEPWTVMGDHSWEPDTIGWRWDAVLYYREERFRRGLFMPCESNIPQIMHISCGGDRRRYADTSNRAMIGSYAVGAARGGSEAWRNWP